jgi:hypothetical protein
MTRALFQTLFPALALALLLAACGKQGQLTPVPPRELPMQPGDTRVPRTAEDMLKLTPQSQPQRVDDPVNKSQERPDDRFNLPPTGSR